VFIINFEKKKKNIVFSIKKKIIVFSIEDHEDIIFDSTYSMSMYDIYINIFVVFSRYKK